MILKKSFPLLVAAALHCSSCYLADGFQHHIRGPKFSSRNLGTQCMSPIRQIGVRFVSHAECCGTKTDLITSPPIIKGIRSLGDLGTQQGSSSSVYNCKFPYSSNATSNQNPWSAMVPPPSPPLINLPRNNGVDVSIEWSLHDDPHEVAKYFIDRCLDFLPTVTNRRRHDLQDPQSIQRLAWSLEMFREYVLQELPLITAKHNTPPPRFKARIVATRGSRGTKCPQWHIDHVPIRWIESLVGRGCEVVISSGADSVDQDGINWSAINGLDDDDVVDVVRDRNKKLVDPKIANIYCAQEGEALLLIGNRWDEFANNVGEFANNAESDSNKACCPPKFTQPAVHKSPSPIPHWEGRVLLTQDVLL